MNSERADEPAVLDQQRTNIGADSRRLQRRSLLNGVRLDRRVADRQCPALQDVLCAARAQVAPPKAAGLRRQSVRVLAEDDAVVAVDWP